MNDETIVFELPDGSVRYCTCPLKRKKPGELKAAWLNRIFLKTIRDHPELTGAQRINNPVLPDGTPFRPGAPKKFYGAWRHAGAGRIEIAMPEARKIRMRQLRAERNERLRAADGPTTREVEQGSLDRQAWIDYKQALRDLPQNFDLSTIATPEALEGFEPVWPTAPGG